MTRCWALPHTIGQFSQPCKLHSDQSSDARYRILQLYVELVLSVKICHSPRPFIHICFLLAAGLS